MVSDILSHWQIRGFMGTISQKTMPDYAGIRHRPDSTQAESEYISEKNQAHSQQLPHNDKHMTRIK